MRNIELIIKQVDASMVMEDVSLTEKDRERIRFCIGDYRKVEDTIDELVNKSAVKREQEYEHR